jgi:hypothetical protein
MLNSMRKGTKRRVRRRKFAGRQPVVITASVVILGVVVLSCAGMLVAPLWTAVVGERQFHANGQKCSMFKDAAARLLCDERLGAVQGANAPVPFRSFGQRTD